MQILPACRSDKLLSLCRCHLEKMGANNGIIIQLNQAEFMWKVGIPQPIPISTFKLDPL